MHLNAVLSDTTYLEMWQYNQKKLLRVENGTFESGMRGCGEIRQYTAVLISSIL